MSEDERYLQELMVNQPISKMTAAVNPALPIPFPRGATVYRTQARDLKPDIEKENYAPADEPQFQIAVFCDGRVAQRWLTASRSMVWWDSLDDLCRVHIYAHPDYGTRVVWSDGEVEEL
jgi:hypothetical protein